MLRLEERGCWK